MVDTKKKMGLVEKSNLILCIRDDFMECDNIKVDFDNLKDYVLWNINHKMLRFLMWDNNFSFINV